MDRIHINNTMTEYSYFCDELMEFPIYVESEMTITTPRIEFAREALDYLFEEKNWIPKAFDSKLHLSVKFSGEEPMKYIFTAYRVVDVTVFDIDYDFDL